MRKDMSKKYKIAQEILGKDFISTEEITKVRKLSYSDQLLEHLAKTFPSKRVIEWLKRKEFMLIAGPPEPMSIKEIRDLNVKLFLDETKKSYEDIKKFFRQDKILAEWLMLRKGKVPKSTDKSFKDQVGLLSRNEYLPNASEIAWAITTYKEARDIFLFDDIYIRTASFAHDDDSDHEYIRSLLKKEHVYLEHDGIYLYWHCDWDSSPYVGITSARKRMQ